MEGRGRLMVNLVTKVMNDDKPLEYLDSKHFQRMCELNKNPDPTFKSLNSSPGLERILDENEYYCNSNNMELIRELASPLLIQIPTKKSDKQVDVRISEVPVASSSFANQELRSTEISYRNECNGLKIIQNNYDTYSDSSTGCVSNQDLISLHDLGITSPGSSRVIQEFMLPEEIGSEPENSLITELLEKPLGIISKQNQNDENTSTDGDFSPTDGSDYVPSSEDSDATYLNEDDPISSIEITNEARESPSLLMEQAHGIEESMAPPCNSNEKKSSNSGRPSRGRKRKCPQNRSERKRARNSNKEYFDHKLRNKPPREFVDFTCKCKKQCNINVPLKTRMNFHQKFWSLGSYNSQTTFLGVFVKEVRNEKPTRTKQFLRKYKIEAYDVCRDMFCKTLNISSTRISTAMDKIHSRKPLLDQRGSKKGGDNRMPDVRKQEIKEFIDSLPLYTSHYSRSNTSAKYFKPGVTLSAVYDQYKVKLTSNAVSYSFFKKFFYRNYNIKVKTLSKDTCNVCDTFRIEIINVGRSGGNVNSIREKHNIHLHHAERARSQLKIDMNLAKNQENIECLTFDMQKTLPLPRIQTNIIFYKRQIWLYNLGVHSAKYNQSYCYTWVEGQAGRGAQEVGSSLLKHIDKNVPDIVKDLILWSDSCGGQNRNIKITLMMKAVLEMKPNLESITFKYLMPGHSYLPNDKDFGDIERALMYNQRIYTPDDYIQIMAICKKKNPLITCQMEGDDFYSTENLEKCIINRKKTTSNDKVNWLKTRELKITKADPYHIYMKSDFDQEYYDCLDITRKISNRRHGSANIERKFVFKTLLSKLWPNGKPIAEPKLRDIISIRHLIPEDARYFYDNLTSGQDIEDDIDGFNTELDFNLDVED